MRPHHITLGAKSKFRNHKNTNHCPVTSTDINLEISHDSKISYYHQKDNKFCSISFVTCIHVLVAVYMFYLNLFTHLTKLLSKNIFSIDFQSADDGRTNYYLK